MIQYNERFFLILSFIFTGVFSRTSSLVTRNGMLIRGLLDGANTQPNAYLSFVKQALIPGACRSYRFLFLFPRSGPVIWIEDITFSG